MSRQASAPPSEEVEGEVTHINLINFSLFHFQFFTFQNGGVGCPITEVINLIADEAEVKISKTRGPGRGKGKEGGATKAKEGKQAMRNGNPANPVKK